MTLTKQLLLHYFLNTSKFGTKIFQYDLLYQQNRFKYIKLCSVEAICRVFLPRHGVSKAFETLSIFWKLNFRRKFQTKCKIFRIKNYDGVAKKGNSSPQVSPVFHKRNLVKVSQIPAY